MGPIPLDISSTHPLCLYQKIEFKTSSCKRDLSSQKIEIWRTLDHMLGNTIFHSSSMLYRIHQLPQANWENVFEGRCIHPWTKNNHRSPCYNHQSLDWQQFCLVSVSSVHICISSNRTTSRSNRFFFLHLASPFYRSYHTSAVAVACWIPWTSKWKYSNSATLSTLANRHFETRDNFILQCGHSFVYSFATGAFLPRSKLMCDNDDDGDDDKKGATRQLHLFAVQFSIHLFRI